MIDPKVLEFRAMLAERKLRSTVPRERLFELLLQGVPLSLREIQTAIGSSSDRVSIYRNLALFEELNIARRVSIGWKHKFELTDKFHYHHHHLSCLKCGSVDEFHDHDELESLINKIGTSAGFTPLNHSFEITGVCATCSDKAS